MVEITVANGDTLSLDEANVMITVGGYQLSRRAGLMSGEQIH